MNNLSQIIIRVAFKAKVFRDNIIDAKSLLPLRGWLLYCHVPFVLRRTSFFFLKQCRPKTKKQFEARVHSSRSRRMISCNSFRRRSHSKA